MGRRNPAVRIPGGENISPPPFGKTYVVISRLILHCSLDSVGQETEDGTSPQQHGETTKHLKAKGAFEPCGRMWANVQRRSPADGTCLQNLTHSGVVGGGVRALGPSRARISAAFALVRP